MLTYGAAKLRPPVLNIPGPSNPRPKLVDLVNVLVHLGVQILKVGNYKIYCIFTGDPGFFSMTHSLET